MIRKYLVVVFVASCFLIIACGVLWNRHTRFKRGELVLFVPEENISNGGTILLNKKDRTIFYDATVSQITLWDDGNRNVIAKYQTVQYRFANVHNTPANEGQIAFYRTYFPKL